MSSPCHIEELHDYMHEHGKVPHVDVYSPFPTNYAPGDAAGRGLVGDENFQHKYRRGVGYASYPQHTRADSQVAYSVLSSQMGNATTEDMLALRHFARFLRTSILVGLTFHRRREGEPLHPQVEVYHDSAYRTHRDGYSHLGVGVLFGAPSTRSGMVDWSSHKEGGAPSQSVPESEVKAAAVATKYALGQRYFAKELGSVQEGPTRMWCDSECAVRNVTGKMASPSTMRHTACVVNFTKFHEKNGTLTVGSVAGVDQRADGLTKTKTPTGHWSMAPQLLGEHPAIDAMRAEVQRRYGRRTVEQGVRADAARSAEYSALLVGRMGMADKRTDADKEIERQAERLEEQALEGLSRVQEEERVLAAEVARANAIINAGDPSGITARLRVRLSNRAAGAPRGVCLELVQPASVAPIATPPASSPVKWNGQGVGERADKEVGAQSGGKRSHVSSSKQRCKERRASLHGYAGVRQQLSGDSKDTA
jgi:hypothetical protein